jgi:hypothetical protein
MFRYLAAWKPSPRRQALYAGNPEGRRHLEFSGIPAKSYEGGKLSPEQVLIVAAGGPRKLSGSAAHVADFLRSGGHLLALGLDQREANALLPFPTGMSKAEHIAAYFPPPPAGSLLSGVGPADVHNRDPKPLSLVSSGATVLGDGVLAQADGARVVFFQFPPYTVTRAQGKVPSLVVDGDDAREGRRSALVTLGMTAGSGVQFGQRLKLPPEVGKTYTFAVFLKGVAGPVRAHLEVERAGSPWDRAVKGADCLVPEKQWTDLHVTFPCETAFPEGWQAYVGCSQDGGRFRADLFRLYEGEYVPWKAPARLAGSPPAAGPRNFFVNPGFESGPKPWFFMFNEQLNLRRTWRRSSLALARLLANMGASASTPLVSRFSTPVGAGGPKPGPSVVRNGDFRRQGAPPAVADQWEFSADSRQAACTREPAGENGRWALRLAVSGNGGRQGSNLMLAQHDVPVQDAQWYCLSFRAKAEGMVGKGVTVALQDTRKWTALLDYRSFLPVEEWRSFRFLLQSEGTARDHTRFQIWHGNAGTLWLADIALVPVAPPSADGRWRQGLYLDQPEEWDDPYRFFRW